MPTPSAALLFAINSGNSELAASAALAYISATEGCLDAVDIRALIQCGEKVLSPEQAWTDHFAHQLRSCVLRCIGKHSSAPNGAALADFLEMHFEKFDRSLQQEILPTLAKLRYSETVGLKITTWLQSRDTSEQRAALYALRDSQTVSLAFMKLFPPLFRSADWSLRLEAIKTFGEIFADLQVLDLSEGMRSIEELVRLLEDESDELVKVVVKAIDSLGQICFTALRNIIVYGTPKSRDRAIQICWDRKERWSFPEDLFSSCLTKPGGHENGAGLRMLATSSPEGLIQVQQEFERPDTQEGAKLQDLAIALGLTQAGSRTLITHALSSKDSPQRAAALATLPNHCAATEFDRSRLLSGLESLTTSMDDPYRIALTRAAIAVSLQGRQASKTPLEVAHVAVIVVGDGN